ncbi:uncharacterized protein APUU_60942A [Aspergillus puulaauensis]|uniref:Secreted protein n=1 Tax=Aspergillus puulaauensis TaxID=1220207 RepID=A0A7R8AQ68_9EURO|nr:uncharacterized protein APUU_60942A [Aspergillus puulaauensis]BCS27894.1 hypothetical protein APUU_60942A [Aspergillus puulaauensis]
MTTALSRSSFLGMFMVTSALGGAVSCNIGCAASPSAEAWAGFVPLPPLDPDALPGRSISMSSVWIDSVDRTALALLLLAGSGCGSPPRLGSRSSSGVDGLRVICLPRVLERTCGCGRVPVLDRDLDAGAVPLLDLDPEAAAGPGSDAWESEAVEALEFEAPNSFQVFNNV